MPNATTMPKGEETMRQRDIVWDPAVGGKRPNTVAATPLRSSAGYDHVGPGMVRGARRQPMVDAVGSQWKGTTKIHDKKARRKQLDRRARRRHALIMSYYRDPQAAQSAIDTRNAIQAAFNKAFEKEHADPAQEPARVAQVAEERAKMVVTQVAKRDAGEITNEQLAESLQAEKDADTSEWVEVGYEDLPPKSGAEQFASVDLSDGLDDLKVGELRKMAVALGMKGGWKGPKKPELIAFIRENRP